MISFAPHDQPDDLLFLDGGAFNDFRAYCRDRRLNWRLIADQALHLGAHDPEAFTRAVDHLTSGVEAPQHRRNSHMATQTANQPRPGTGVIGPVRFSYLTAFKPRENAMRAGEMEYSVVALIPKLPNEFCKDPKAIGKRVQELIQEALAAKFGATPPKWETCLKDGDMETNSDGLPKHPGYWFIPARCNAEYPPLCVDGHQQKVTSGWNSGDWGNVKISFFGYEFQGKKGVSAGLRGIQFLFHDEAFGGGGTTADEFPVVENAHASATTDDGTDGQPAADGCDPFADE